MLDFARKTLKSITSETDSLAETDVEDNSPEAIAERERQDLQAQIIALWGKVWFGLYQVEARDGPYRNERLRKLYLGAGMSTRVLTKSAHDDEHDDRFSADLRSPRVGFGLLGKALSYQSRGYVGGTDGFTGLRLFEGQTLSSLRSVIELLQAYEREIAPLGEVFTLLRGLQVGLRAPTTEDEDAVLKQYPAVADPIAKRLLHYDARLDVLVMEMQDEARAMHDDRRLQLGWLVADQVIRRPKSGVSIFASGSRA